MKINITYTLILFCIWKIGFSQSTLITPGNNQPSITATSSNSGVIIPRVTLTNNLSSASPLNSPLEGTLVYNIGANQIHGFYFWTGAAWSSLGVAISSLTAASPIAIQANTVKLNAGTTIGQLITWDGANWINTSPKPTTNVPIMQPFLVLNFCIATQGIFPSRSGADPFLGEIEIFAFNFAPVGWALCNGQLLSIASNTALFALLGTQYGGNGTTTFALPDLRGRVPLHFGTGTGLTNKSIGQQGGTETTPINDKY
jgi:microcystin-dependent protein